MKNSTKIFLGPDYMIRNGPICQAGLFCKVATSALFSRNLINFYDFCCGLPRCRVPSGFRNFWVGMCRCYTGEPLAYTRARPSEFCYPILDLTPKIPPPPPPHPRVAVFQKLLRSQTKSSQNKTDLIFSYL